MPRHITSRGLLGTFLWRALFSNIESEFINALLEKLGILVFTFQSENGIHGTTAETKANVMIVKNTSQYSSEEVENLVRFALKGIPHAGELEVHVRNSKHAFYGRIFASAADCTCDCDEQRFLIVVRIGNEKRFPYFSVYPGHKRCEKYATMLNDWKEALVKVAAHEGMHLRQWIGNKPMWEHQAEKHAITTLTKYRNTTKSQKCLRATL